MIEVRIAVSEPDKAECLRIREEVFIIEQNVPVAIERDAYDVGAIHFLAIQGGAAIGTARVVVKDNGKTAKIGRVAVCKAARGTGVGQALMAAIEASRALGQIEQFVLEAQTHALSFYERRGYAAYGEEFMEADLPHRSMRKVQRAG
jgi:predicted GNAT family N-acyltransferase